MSFSIQGAQIASHVQDCQINASFIFISWHALLHELRESTCSKKHPIPNQYRPTYIFFTSVVGWAYIAAQKFPWKMKTHLGCASTRGSYFHLGVWITNATCEYYSLKALLNSKEVAKVLFFFSSKENKLLARMWWPTHSKQFFKGMLVTLLIWSVGE